MHNPADNLMVSVISFLTNYNSFGRVNGIVLESSTVPENIPVHKNRVRFNSIPNLTRVRISAIEWSLNMSGELKPQVVLSIKFNGNFILKSLDLDAVVGNRFGIGAVMDVIKVGNDIHIVRVLEEAEVSFPDKCPMCKKKLTNRNDSLYCENIGCIGENFNKVYYFFKMMGVRHISKGTFDKLHPTTIEEVYNYFSTTGRPTGLYTRAMYDKIRRKIFSILKTQPQKFLKALGIPGVSDKVMGEILARHKGMEGLFSITKAEDVGVKGKKTAAAIFNKVCVNKALFDFLVRKGLAFIPEPDKIFAGIEFVIDGNVPENKNVLMDDIENLGGKIARHPTIKTDYLLSYYGDTNTRWPSYRCDYARKNNIPHISWSTYLQIRKGELPAVKRI
jgi:NAD-dependent DNA ligase